MPQPLAPDDIVETHAEGAANEREPLLVLEPLREFLEASDLAGPRELTANAIGEGHSNITFGLSTGVVLRRPPRGPLPPSAHDVLREARLLCALEGTAVRVPRVLAVCDDPAVIGAPFYVMELVEGDVIATELPERFDTPAERERVATELIDGLVELHGVDWQAVGLDGFGRPTGYLERQLRRFTGLWEHNRTRDLPAVEEVGAWLARNIPDSGAATIVHGDYRLGNVLYAPGTPARLASILDWEMATIGDPLADLGYLLLNWYQDGDPVTAFTIQTVTGREGFPRRSEVIGHYSEKSGRQVTDVNWYVTLAIWKTVVFMEGNYRRAVAGTTDDPYLRSFGAAVVELAEHALTITRAGFE